MTSIHRSRPYFSSWQRTSIIYDLETRSCIVSRQQHEVIQLCLLGTTSSFQSPPTTSKSRTTSLLSSTFSTTESIDLEAAKVVLVGEFKEISACATLVMGPIFQPDESVTPQDIVRVLCDEFDALNLDSSLFTSEQLQLRRRSSEFKRCELLAKMMRKDYDAYVATASFLSPSRIPPLMDAT